MITCEFRSSCGFYNDLKARRPVTLESVKEEFCDSNYSRCARFMVSKAQGPANVSKYLFPEDVHKAFNIIADPDQY